MNTPIFERHNATKSDTVRQSIIQSAIQAVLNHEYNFHLGHAGEVHVQEPDYISLSVNPDHGCRAVVYKNAQPKCDCEVMSVMGLCSHSVSAFIWSQRVREEGAMEQAA